MPTLVLEDSFPATTGFVLGGDNTATPTGSGEYMVFKLGTGEGRTELSLNSGSAAQKWVEGESFLIEYKITVASGWGYGGVGKHNTVTQFKGLGPPGEGAGSPFVALELSNYNSEGNGLYALTEAKEQKRLMAAASLEGKEVLVQIWVAVSKTKAGKYLIKLNGSESVERSSVNTLQTDAEYGFLKTGIYKAATSSACEHKIRDWRVYSSPVWGESPSGEGGGGGGGETGVPETTTKPATSVTTTGAVPKGETNPHGIATVSWFRYGTSETLATYSVTEDKAVGSGGTVFAAFEQTLSGLSPGTKYFYKIGAENTAGKVFGEILNFTTEAEHKTVEFKAALARTSKLTASIEKAAAAKSQNSKPKTTVKAGGWAPPEGKAIHETLSDGNDTTRIKGTLH